MMNVQIYCPFYSMKIRDCRQVAGHSVRSQPFPCTRVTYVLDQRPHVVDRILTTQKHASVYLTPELNPRPKISFVSSRRRRRNGISDEPAAKMHEHRCLPSDPRSCICHGTSGRRDKRLEETSFSGHREIPSATSFRIPGTCFASNIQPESISNNPSMRIKAPDRGPLPPPHFFTQVTAEELSPRKSTQSAGRRGRCPPRMKTTHADITMPNSASSISKRPTIRWTESSYGRCLPELGFRKQ